MWMLISHTACSRSSCQKCSTRTAREYTCRGSAAWFRTMSRCIRSCKGSRLLEKRASVRSEEHTSELQSLRHLVCRLLLEKKKKTTTQRQTNRETQPRSQSHPIPC